MFDLWEMARDKRGHVVKTQVGWKWVGIQSSTKKSEWMKDTISRNQSCHFLTHLPKFCNINISANRKYYRGHNYVFFCCPQKCTLLFIAKTLLGRLPIYICGLLSYYTCNYSTRSTAKLLLKG